MSTVTKHIEEMLKKNEVLQNTINAIVKISNPKVLINKDKLYFHDKIPAVKDMINSGGLCGTESPYICISESGGQTVSLNMDNNRSIQILVRIPERYIDIVLREIQETLGKIQNVFSHSCIMSNSFFTEEDVQYSYNEFIRLFPKKKIKKHIYSLYPEKKYKGQEKVIEFYTKPGNWDIISCKANIFDLYNYYGINQIGQPIFLTKSASGLYLYSLKFNVGYTVFRWLELSGRYPKVKFYELGSDDQTEKEPDDIDEESITIQSLTEISDFFIPECEFIPEEEKHDIPIPPKKRRPKP